MRSARPAPPRKRRAAGAAAWAVLLIVFALGACAKHDEGHAPAPRPAGDAGPARNPSDFPLYPGSVVVTVVPVESAQMFAAIRMSDPHANVPRNFRGHEVIAQTSVSMKTLTAWVAALKAAPPHGFHVSSTHLEMTPDTASGTRVDSLVGGQFDGPNGTRSVYVVAADPRRIRQQIGTALDLIDNYANVPLVVRAPIDDQSKKQLGYSVSEMLDGKSPVGAALAALKTLGDKDRRAILVIDESGTP
jgi:hypothetical protein